MKWSIVAASADGEWLQISKNADDYANLLKKNIRFVVTPQSVRDAQLSAWDKVIADESKDNPDFVAILKSQKAWAERIFPWADTINIPTPDAPSFAPGTGIFFSASVVADSDTGRESQCVM